MVWPSSKTTSADASCADSDASASATAKLVIPNACSESAFCSSDEGKEGGGGVDIIDILAVRLVLCWWDARVCTGQAGRGILNQAP